MAKKFNYTLLAHRYTARFPLLTYVGTQINFWILANLLLVIIIHLQSQVVRLAYGIQVAGRLEPLVVIATIAGVLYGISLGLTNYYLEKKMFREFALGKIMLLKTISALTILVFMVAMLRYVFFDVLISPTLYMSGITLNEEAWRSLFNLLLIYYFCMTLVISFINQVNKKYGPGILVPLLLGRYRDPQEEERIFMFMDLKSSTNTAEALGHLQYSAFIRDCFSDINDVLYPFRAQVYQYVGDEIVVTWPESEGIKNHCCLEFYFACRKQFQARAEYYRTTYGFLPEFKAGMHAGTVTVVEIGDVKRDIAYHGDTLNTASRIQHVCNDYNKTFLVSKSLLETVGEHPNMVLHEIGTIVLKGKSAAIELVSVDWVDGVPDH